MVTFRRLVNTAILNSEKWIGFQGDSEYQTEDGEWRLGYWTFLGVYKEIVDGYAHSLDEEITDDEFNEIMEMNNGRTISNVENDNGTVCLIGLIY